MPAFCPRATPGNSASTQSSNTHLNYGKHMLPHPSQLIPILYISLHIIVLLEIVVFLITHFILLSLRAACVGAFDADSATYTTVSERISLKLLHCGQ